MINPKMNVAFALLCVLGVASAQCQCVVANSITSSPLYECKAYIAYRDEIKDYFMNHNHTVGYRVLSDYLCDCPQCEKRFIWDIGLPYTKEDLVSIVHLAMFFSYTGEVIGILRPGYEPTFAVDDLFEAMATVAGMYSTDPTDNVLQYSTGFSSFTSLYNVTSLLPVRDPEECLRLSEPLAMIASVWIDTWKGYPYDKELICLKDSEYGNKGGLIISETASITLGGFMLTYHPGIDTVICRSGNKAWKCLDEQRF